MRTKFNRFYLSLCLLALAFTPIRASGQTVTFTTSNENMSNGIPATVSVSVAGFSQVTTFQFTMQWNPTVVQFVSISSFNVMSISPLDGSTNNSLFSGNFGTQNAANGKLTVSWDDPNGSSTTITNGTVIFKILFNAVGEVGSSSTVDFAGLDPRLEVTVNLIPVQVNTQVGTVTVVGNNRPTISTIANQTINEDSPSGAIPFTVGDTETAAASLVVTASSSNAALVPNTNLALGGSGANRTLTISPAANQSGTATITVTVTDPDGASANTAFGLTVNSVNDLPTISDIANQTTDEDTTTTAIPFTIGDVETATTSLTVSGASSDTSLVANDKIIFGGSGANRTVTLTPAPNKFGAATITITVKDAGLDGIAGNGDDASVSDTFLMTFVSKNDFPTISSISNQSVTEDTASGPIAFTVGDVETAPDSLTLSATTANPTLVPVANIVFGGSGTARTVTITPAANQSGTSNIKILVTDGDGGSSNTTFDFIVGAINDPPTGSADSLTSVAEDSGVRTITFASLLANDSAGPAEESQSLTITAVDNAQGGTVAINGTNVEFTPASNFHGAASFVYTLQDNGTTAGADDFKTATATVSFTITEVNDSPTGSADSLPSVAEDSGVRTITFASLLANDSTGPSNESSQSLTITQVATAVGGSVAINGTDVQFTPAANFNGAASFVYTLQDNGTTAGVNDFKTATATVSFTITEVNDSPSGSADSLTNVAEDSGVRTISFASLLANDSAGPSNESGQTLTITQVGNAVGGTVAINGTDVQFSPTLNFNGPASFDYTLQDNGTSGDEDFKTATANVSFTINSVNDLPQISDIQDQTVLTNTTVTVFFAVFDVETPAADLTITRASSNPTLVPVANIVLGGAGEHRSAAVTPAPNQTGTATLTVTVTDGNGATASDTFVLTVNANFQPTITDIANDTINEDGATLARSFTVGDVESSVESLTVFGSSSDTAIVPTSNIVFGGTGASRTVRVTPATNQNGPVTITVTVRDPDGGSGSDSFVLTINAVNDAPSFTKGIDVGILEDPGPQSLPGWATGISAGPANEVGQTLAFEVSNNNNELFSVPPAVASNGTLTFTPALNANGSANVTLILVDNGGIAHGGADRSGSQTFTIAVIARNDAPTITDIPDQSTPVNTPTPAIPFTIGDVDDEVVGLTASATSSNPTLLHDENITIGGTGANRSLTLVPSLNQTGTATITVTISDGEGGATTDTFVLNVLPRIVRFVGGNVIEGRTNSAVVELDALGTENALGFSLNYNFTLLRFVEARVGVDAAGATLNVNTLQTESGRVGLIMALPAGQTFAAGTRKLVEVRFAASVGTPEQPILGLTPVTFGDQPILKETSDVLAQKLFTAYADGAMNIIPPNTPPLIDPIADQTTNEDTPITVNFVVGDNETTPDTLTLTAISSNQSLVPDGSLVLGGADANRSVTITPALNQSGTATITLTAKDPDPNSFTTNRTFLLTVVAVNDAPTLDAIGNLTIFEDAGSQTVPLAGIGTGASNESQALVVTATSSNPSIIANPTIVYNSPDATGSLTFASAPNANGSAVITVAVSDGGAANAVTTRNFTVNITPVNDAPTLNAIANIAVDEDAAAQTVNLAGISTGAPDEVQSLTITATSSNPGLIPTPAVTYTSPNATGSLRFTPEVNANGIATITVTISDGSPANPATVRTFTVTVRSVNDSPSINSLADLKINEDAGTQSVALSGIGSGASNEGELLTVTASSSDPALIPTPVVAYTQFSFAGTLTFAPAPNASGSATLTVSVTDAGGTTSRSFLVAVSSINDPPTLNAIANREIGENSPPQTVALSGIGTGAANETQTLTITSVSSHPALIPNPVVNYTSPNATGSLVYSPLPGVGGTTVTITVTVNDGGAENNVVSQQFKVALGSVIDPPTLNTIADLTIDEDANQQTVPLTGITFDSLSTAPVITATSSNPSLLRNLTLTYTKPNTTGTLTFIPVTDQSGTATITLTLTNGTGVAGAFSQQFLVTVRPVNDRPTLAAVSTRTINEDAGVQTVSLTGISTGTPTELQTLTIRAVSSGLSLIPNPTIAYSSPNATATLTFASLTNANGSAKLTVTVDDGNEANGTISQTFDVNVTAVNDPPTLDPIANLAVDEDAGKQEVTLTGIGTGAPNETQTLKVGAVSSNPNLIPHPTVTYTSPNGSGSLSFAAAANGSGTATITVTVDDAGGANATVTRVFVVTVNSVNDAPTLNAIADVVVDENAGPQEVPLAGITSGAADEVQVLSVKAESSDLAVVPSPTVVYTSPAGTGILRFTLVTNANGTATITVTVADGGAVNGVTNRSFTVRVREINQPPVVAGEVRTTPEDTALSFAASELTTNDVAGPPNEAGQTLTVVSVSATSTNGGTVTLAGGQVKYSPRADFHGVDQFAYTVQDNGTTGGAADPKSANGTVTVTVTEVNDSPVAVEDLRTTPEITPLVFLAGTLVTNDAAGPADETGQTLTVTSVSPASEQGGTVSLAGGTITYRPPEGFHDVDTFTYVAQDNGTTAGAADPKQAIGTVKVNVTASTPKIVEPPKSVVVARGGTARFTVVAAGSEPLRIQWRFVNANLPGQTNATLILTDVQSANAGPYSASVSNAAGVVTSAAADLIVVNPPQILSQPIGGTNLIGDNFGLGVIAVGSEPLDYQWRRDGVPLPGETRSSLVFLGIEASASGDYTVVVTNTAGVVTSQVARILVRGPVTIAQQPLSQAVTNGSNVRFFVVVTNVVGNVTFQWRLNGIAIDGERTSELALANVQSANAGTYDVVITSVDGVARSAEAKLEVFVSPQITSQPQGQTNVVEARVTFAVQVNGTAPLSYQWMKDGADISGATAASYSIGSLQASDAGGYSVLVKNLAGEAASSVATLGVNVPVKITQPPLSQVVNVGGNVTFEVVAIGTVPLNYQWRFKGVNIPGATNSTLALTNVVLDQAGVYMVEVGNPISSVPSSDATLTVNDPPRITQQPGSRSVTNGTTVTFDVVAAGTAPLSHQWLSNGVAIAGATGTSYTIVNAQQSAAAGYSVLVTNLAGRVTSSVAVLAILVPPSITQQPSDQRVPPGSDVTFSVVASGDAPFNYQWLLNGANIPGATSASYTIRNVQTTNQGNYSVVVVNAAGAATSRSASLELALPSIGLVDNFDDQLPPSLLSEGEITYDGGNNQNATREGDEPNHGGRRASKSLWFSIRAPGSGTITIATRGSNFDTVLSVYTGNRGQGLRLIDSDDDRGGFSTSELTFNAEAGVVYRVAVDGVNGAFGRIVVSLRFVLTAIRIPLFVTHPQDQSVAEGDDATFTVVATNPIPGENLSYQWFFNDQQLGGRRSSTLTINNVRTNDVGSYTVKVTNRDTTVESLPANLQISVGDTVPSEDKFGDTTGTEVSLISLQGPRLPRDRRKSALARGYSGTQVFNTFGASKEQGEPNHGGVVGGASQWFAYQAPTNGVVKISTEGSDFDTVVAVYTGPGTDFESLKEEGSNNDISTNKLTSQVTVPVTKDTIYYIAVDGVNGAQGTVQLGYELAQAVAIVQQPLSVTAIQGATANLSVIVSNRLAAVTTNGIRVDYEFLRNGLQVSRETNALLTTTRTFSLALTNLALAQGGNYVLVVTNFAGAVTSAVASVSVIVPVSITTGPRSQTVAARENVTLSVSASGTLPVSYQWRFNGAAVSGATGSSLVISNVQPASAGNYTVTVSNVVSSLESAAAVVSVREAPRIASQPQGGGGVVGSTVTFLVGAEGTGTLGYQWRLNGVSLAGANAATLVLNNVQPAQAGNYSVVVTNDVGSVASSDANLSLVVAATILRQPQSQGAIRGDRVVLSVTADGTQPISYQWRVNGANIGGATAANFALSEVGLTNSGAYSVVVSNSAGSVVSANANLVVEAGALQFVSASRLANGQVQLRFTGTASRDVVIQASTDQINWTSLTTVNLADGTAQHLDAEASGLGLRFYRAYLVKQ